MTGEWPTGEVDHEDRNPVNDRWANLRDVTHRRNQQNMSMHRDNTSGYLGVAPSRERWRAQLGKQHLGVFDTPEAAHAAYIAAKEQRDG